MKHRQHYVWRKYLEPWCTEEKVWCLRMGQSDPFHTNPLNVGVERDFYRIEPLASGDLEFITKLAIEPTKTTMLRQLNEGWLGQFAGIFSLINLIDGNSNINAGIQSKIDELLNDLEENRFSKIEDEAVHYLGRLVDGDGTFLQEDDGVMEFSIFLIYQYFRTKKIQETILSKFTGSHKLQFKRCWPILRHIFVTNVAFSVFSRRDVERPILLRNNSDCSFITSDQPVINTYGVHKGNAEQVDRVEFYYPVSPQYAVIFSDHSVHAEPPEEGMVIPPKSSGGCG